MATFFFCGIGGIGMSSIALYLKKKGHTVLGSDRSFDQNKAPEMQQRLQKSGIVLFPQDGSSISPYIDTFVISSAVEERIPDVKRAKELGLTIKSRAEVLAEILSEHFGVAVAGTSGKTTVTAMVGHILYTLKKHPLMINGGISCNVYNNDAPSNLLMDGDEVCVIEADESDGSIERYIPDLAVVTNITLDHKNLDETKPLFKDFLMRARKGIVLNWDDSESRTLDLDRPNIITFSAKGNSEATLYASDIQESLQGMHFKINGQATFLPMIGHHNIENALAAVGLCMHMNISIQESMKALQSFLGTKRRMTLVGEVNDIFVFDDYAHNPAKIQAALNALKPLTKRIFAIYQPHGFGPLRLMKETLIQMLKQQLDSQTEWIMLPVFYAGGTVCKDISSDDIVVPLQQHSKRAVVLKKRQEVIDYVQKRACPGDSILVMGARDNSLSDFANDIFIALGGKHE